MSDKNLKLSKPSRMRSLRKEAKNLHETLRATVGSTPSQKKGPQSLSESVNRRSNLSSMLNSRQNINESKSADPFLEKMQKLAGIKKYLGEKKMSIIETLTEGIVNRNMQQEGAALLTSGPQTGLLEGLNESQKAKHGCSSREPSKVIVERSFFYGWW